MAKTPKLKSAESILRAVEKVIGDLRAGKVSIEVARTILYGLQTGASALRNLHTERELEKAQTLLQELKSQLDRKPISTATS